MIQRLFSVLVVQSNIKTRTATLLQIDTMISLSTSLRPYCLHHFVIYNRGIQILGYATILCNPTTYMDMHIYVLFVQVLSYTSYCVYTTAYFKKSHIFAVF